VRKTMQVAQRLYEGIELGADGSVGLITYMRTDSPRVSDDALVAVRQFISTTYGEDFVPDKPVLYKSKRDAQDAHEAIRPTDTSRDPASVRRYLSKDEYGLYKLIWDRFVASQMKPAVYDETVVDIAADAYLLRAKGSTLKFQGFLAVYFESPDEIRAPRPKAEGAEDQEPEPAAQVLPPLAEGEVLKLQKIEPDQHFTQPPPRFSEASLVKELEENGIGRPSTYASIIATIEAREYMEKRDAKLYPTELGFVVTDLLVKHFSDIMNVEYTAAMEKALDEIEEGRDTFLNTLLQFWGKFAADLKRADVEMEQVKAMEEKTDEVCERCGSPMVLKWGRYGKFLACSKYPECKNTRQMAGSDGPALGLAEDGAQAPCPKCGQPMVLKKGRFGPFLACVGYPECRTTQRLVRGPDGKYQAETFAPIDEKCPECSQPLAWRRGRFGPFIACSAYPTCKYVKKNEPKEIGVLCPECGQGQVVERKGRWGRSFYGCRRYPECRFASQHRPVPEPCPECGRAYLLEKETRKQGRVVFCGAESCSYERS
jgi:DNA topoisomerase-1